MSCYKLTIPGGVGQDFYAARVPRRGEEGRVGSAAIQFLVRSKIGALKNSVLQIQLFHSIIRSKGKLIGELFSIAILVAIAPT